MCPALYEATAIASLGGLFYHFLAAWGHKVDSDWLSHIQTYAKFIVPQSEWGGLLLTFFQVWILGWFF